jgi:hypothetical protein
VKDLDMPKQLASGLALMAVLSSSCVPAMSTKSEIVAGGNLDDKLAHSTWIADGDITLIASSRATRFRLKQAYVPVEIAIVNRGLKSLSLTRESFSLIDARGNRYPAVDGKELEEKYKGSVDLDRERFTEAAPIVFGKYASYTHVPSNFSPGFDNSIARDHVFLPRYSYIVDFVYFPSPEGYTNGEPLELRVSAPELPDPVFIRFTVPSSH